MKLTVQKKLAGQIFKCSPRKIRMNSDRLADIKESITKADIRALIIDKAITAKPVEKSSKGRIRKHLLQKRKGRQSGRGSIKGTKTARSPRKLQWIIKIRKQRGFLQELREKKIIDSKSYRELYMKAKGGLFRSKEHLKLYINERGYINK